jgi:hypothetical protein
VEKRIRGGAWMVERTRSWSWFYEIFILRSKVQIRPSAEQAEPRREMVMDEKYNTATPLHLESSAKDKYVKSVHCSLIAKCEISAHLVHHINGNSLNFNCVSSTTSTVESSRINKVKMDQLVR